MRNYIEMDSTPLGEKCINAGNSMEMQELEVKLSDKHIKDAEKYYAEMKYHKAKESYQFAARLYRNNNLPAYYALCYNGIGNIYIDLSLFEKAKSKGFDVYEIFDAINKSRSYLNDNDVADFINDLTKDKDLTKDGVIDGGIY